MLNNETPKIGDPDYKPYDGKNLSYAGTFNSPLKTFVIKSLELVTGKLTLMRLVRDYEKTLRQEDETFWSKALSHLQINLSTPEDQVARIPKSGPLIIVANHPHGLVDGLVLAELTFSSALKNDKTKFFGVALQNSGSVDFYLQKSGSQVRESL